MDTLYQESARHYEDGLSDFEIKPKIMADPFMKSVVSQWPGYESGIGKFIVIAL